MGDTVVQLSGPRRRRSRLERVLALHSPVTTTHPSRAVVCRECMVLFPCRTRRVAGDGPA